MSDEEYRPYCSFCGAHVGEKSERTGEMTTAIYYCAKCECNYCDQCSWARSEGDESVQICLRCDGLLEEVT